MGQLEPSDRVSKPLQEPWKINKSVISVIIIILATLAGIWLIRPLFAPGYLMNFDHPLRQGLIQCYLDGSIWSLPGAWCGYVQVGVAPFQSYLIMFNYIVLFFHVFASLALSYKLALMVVWFLLPTAIAVVLFRAGHPLAAGFAFALLLLEHGAQDASGLEFFIINNTGMGQMLGNGMLVICFALAIRFFRDPTLSKMAVLSLASAIYFLSHPTTFLIFLPVLIVLAVINHVAVRRHFMIFLAYPVTSFLLVAHWLIPVVINSQSNEISSVVMGVHSIWPDAILIIRSNMNPLLIILGAAGLALAIYQGRQEILALPIFAASILAAWTLWPWISYLPILNFSQFPRTIGMMHSLLLVGVALLLDSVASIRLRTSWGKAIPQWWQTCAILIIFVLIASLVIAQTSTRTKDIITSDHAAFQSLFGMIRDIKPIHGRILLEETYSQDVYPANSSTLWGIGPIVTSSEMIHPILRFFRNPYGGTQGGGIGKDNLENMSRKNVSSVLEDFNIEYVLAGSQIYQTSFSFLSGRPIGNFILYKNDVTPLGYFKPSVGDVVSESYNKTRATANLYLPEDGIVTFKVRFWNNWGANLDKTTIPIERTDKDYMRAKVPAGNHILEFRYSLRWWDYLGWFLTVACVAACIGIFLYERFIQKPKVVG